MPVSIAATFDIELMKQVAEVVGVEGRALSQRDYNSSFDHRSKLYGVSLNSLVCKDAAEVNMNRGMWRAGWNSSFSFAVGE